MKKSIHYIECIYISIFILFVSFPIFGSYIIYGSDLLFHLLRIESIKEGILSGQIPVRLYQIRLNGSGDATGFFYPSLFLYIPALLRIAGFSITNSINIFILIINCITFAACYWAVEKITKNIEISIISALLYLSSLFRMMHVYSHSAMGTYLGLTFIPIVFVSFYFLLNNEKEYLTYFIIGFTGVMQSHIISTLLCAFGCIMIFVCSAIYNHKIINKYNIKCLIKCIIIIFLLNIWFYYPFIEFYNDINFKIKNPVFSARSLINCGYNALMVSQFFYGLPVVILSIIGIGFFVAISINSIYIKFIKNIFFINIIISILFLIICTNLIPYKEIIGYPVIGKFISTIQSPIRLLELSLLSISIAAGISLYFIFHNIVYKKLYIIVVLFVCLFVNYESLNTGCISIIDEKGTILPRYLHKVKEVDTQILDYMQKFDAAGTAIDYVYSDYIPSPNRIAILAKDSGIEIDSIQKYIKRGLSINFDTNYMNDIDALLPILYYPGYKISITNNNMKIVAEEGPAHYIKIHIPKGNHNINVEYVGLIKWRIAEIVSLVTLFLFVISRYNLKLYDKIMQFSCLSIKRIIFLLVRSSKFQQYRVG